MPWDLEDMTSLASLAGVGRLGPTHQPTLIRRNGVITGQLRHAFVPPCECSECKQQFRPLNDQGQKTWTYTTALSDDEAREAAAKLTRSIFENLEYLQTQCELNGNTLLKRWRKKSCEERQALLLEVDTQMYPHQWADVYFDKEFWPTFKEKARIASKEAIVTAGQARRAFRNACLLPYISLEGLSKDPARLLSLLLNRTQYSPKQWAAYDNFLLNQQWQLGSFDTMYNANCIVMHGEKYGTLTPWKNDEAHSWRTVGFPRGYLILEAQEKLMSFLRKVATKLLDGHVRIDNIPQSDNFYSALENGLKKLNEKSSSTEFASVYLNQPFSAPPIFDIQNLLSIAQAQLALHGDHLWLLQTEPSYMRRYSALVLAGTMGESLSKYHRKVITTSWLMRDATWYWTWEWILEEVQKLGGLEDIAQGSKTLSQESERALSATEELLNHLLKFRSKQISLTLPLRPGFRDCWVTKFKQDSNSSSISLNRADPDGFTAAVFFKDRLDFCLTAMVLDPVAEKHRHLVPQYDHAMLFSILDEHLTECSNKNKKKELARLDEVLYALFSDLSAVHQMLTAIHFRRPCVSRREFKEVKAEESGKGWRYIKSNFLEQCPWRPIQPSRAGEWEDAVKANNRENPNESIKAEQRLADLLSTFLETPKPKGRANTKVWLDDDDRQRATLGAFWEGMRQRHRGTLTRLGFGEEDVSLDLKALSADISENHVQAIKAQRDETIAEIARKDAEMASKRRGDETMEAQAQWGSDDQSSLYTKMENIKIKTRGTANDYSGEDSSAASEPEEEKVTVAVTKRALSVFKSMFPGRDLEDRSKNVEWEQFVNAMGEGEVGFVARHAGGAAFSFEPNESSAWFGKGKIVFHKPHPETYFDHIQMATNGKRMQKWFGWNEDTFVLK